MIHVTINGYQMLETFGMYMTYRKIGTAKPNIYKQSIPGMNGSLNYTSFYGETTFENREIELKFAKKVDADTQNLKDQIENTFNGKEVKVVFSDDTAHYWKGTASIEENDDDTKVHNLYIIIDTHPFKFNVDDDSEVR